MRFGCRNLSVQFYGSETPVLSDVTLSFGQGERVLILGPSGCGKSTLIQTLAGVIPKAIDAMTKGEVHRPERTGMLFQDPDSQFCMLSVDDEIAFSLENRNMPREQMPFAIERVKQQAGIGHLDGKTQISALSGGMKQRLALAAVLACEPEALFLDEPTAQIDPSGTKELIDVLKQLDRSRTLILVEHKLDGIIDWMDRVILLDPNGRVIADGDPLSVFKQHKRKIDAYGIWKPRLWPATWEEVVSGAHNGQVASWKPLKNPREKHEPLLTMTNGTLMRKKQPVFSGVDVTIDKGDWVAVMGPNGAGKSSFLQTIMGLLRLSHGSLIYSFKGDQQTGPMKPEKLSDSVGFVFQNPEHQFVTDHVEDEVNFIGKVEGWPEAETKARTEKLLREFHLSPFRKANPYTLSVGQKRRLSVASMLLKQHELLLLDEPTFGQDRAMTDELLARLDNLRRQGVTIIMATHDVEIAYRYADRLLVFAEGSLLYDGEPHGFFGDPNLLSRAKCEKPLYVEYLQRRSLRKERVAGGQ
jgi:energy-coupling factor transport system ATP-binding protein